MTAIGHGRLRNFFTDECVMACCYARLATTGARGTGTIEQQQHKRLSRIMAQVAWSSQSGSGAELVVVYHLKTRYPLPPTRALRSIYYVANS